MLGLAGGGPIQSIEVGHFSVSKSGQALHHPVSGRAKVHHSSAPPLLVRNSPERLFLIELPQVACSVDGPLDEAAAELILRLEDRSEYCVLRARADNLS
jgi:hypothetical protein